MNLAEFLESNDRAVFTEGEGGSVFVDLNECAIAARLLLFSLADYAVTTAAAAGCYWLALRRPAAAEVEQQPTGELSSEDLAQRLPRRLRRAAGLTRFEG